MSDWQILSAILCGTVGLVGLTITAGIGWLRAERQRGVYADRYEKQANAFRAMGSNIYVRGPKGRFMKLSDVLKVD